MNTELENITPAEDTSASAGEEEKINDGKKGKKPKKKFKHAKLIRNIIIAVLVLALAFSTYKWIGPAFGWWGKTDEVQAKVISVSETERGDIVSTITGDSVIEAMKSYDILAPNHLAGKDILQTPHQEGETVREGETLFVIDSSDAQTDYNQVYDSYKLTMKQKEYFSVTAETDGYVSGIDPYMHVGDEIQNGKVLASVNAKSVNISIPFSAAAFNAINIGDAATLSSSKYMTAFQGKVVSKDTPRTNTFNVSINFNNDGSFEDGDVLAAKIGAVTSSGSGVCSISKDAKAKMNGDLASIKVKNGDYVKAGQVLFTLSNDETSNKLNNASDTLDKAKEKLDDCVQTAPITGTIMAMDYTAGDEIPTSTGSVKLATIADVSKMKFTISVDELDVQDVQVGQSVVVTADALEGQSFSGRVSTIQQIGTSTNGVATYPVEIVIDEPGNLMIGMNVSATISVSKAENVIKAPLDAVSQERGKYYVYVLNEDVEKIENAPEEEKNPPKRENSEQGSEDFRKMRHDGANSENGAANGERMQRGDGASYGGGMQRGEGASYGGGMQRGQNASGENSGQQNRGGGQTPRGDANVSLISNVAYAAEEENKSEENKENENNSEENKNNENPEENKEEENKEEERTYTDDDFTRIEVTIGESDDSYVEIKSGLIAGVRVKIVKTISAASNSNQSSMFGGMANMHSGMAGGMGGGMSGMGGANRSGGSFGGNANRSGGSFSGGASRTGASGGARSGGSYGR